MQTSGLPTRVSVPFADSGAKNPIPIASQLPGSPGAASFTDGFPPATMLPLTAGGIPPAGKDFNGILNAITNSLRWASAGGTYSFNAAFATAIGGYPKGATVARAAYDGIWVSTVENNTSNPDAGGAGWVQLAVSGGNYAVDTGGANAYVAAFIPAVTALADGVPLVFKAKVSNTGASTFSPNGLTAKPVLGGAHQPLQGGEIVAGGDVQVIFIASLDSWVLLSSTGGSPQVPNATKSLHSANYGQVLSLVTSARSAAYIYGAASIQPGTYNVDTTGGSFTLTLPPAPSVGDAFTFIDANNTWDLNNWTLDLNGKTIENLAGPLVVDKADQQWSLLFRTTTWEFV